MSIQYKLSINTIPKDSTVIDIYYNDNEIVSPLGKLIPINRYDFISISDKKVYLDMEKITSKLKAGNILWDGLNISKYYIHIPTDLLNANNDVMEFILSSVVRELMKNVYKNHHNIIITHNGKENSRLRNILSMIEKVQVARLLAMLPSNIATPELIAKRIQKIFNKIPSVKTRLLNKTYLQKHNFGLILAVNGASRNNPCMLTIERKTNPKNPTICIIGKGITFDSGGLAIKPLRHMKDMKYDKTGAVSGSMALAHLLELPSLKHINFIGIFPFAENVISENAVKPGDVVKSYLGKTVEIVNPDAEGRLILADAFAYAHRYKPDLVIDIATLTGHAEYINCWHHGYYFAEPEPFKHMVEKITNDIGERMIPMPTWTEYSEVLQSPVADLLNDSDICDDSFTAALFIKEFLPKNCEWLHIDLAHENDGHIANGNGIRSIINIISKKYNKK